MPNFMSESQVQTLIEDSDNKTVAEVEFTKGFNYLGFVTVRAFGMYFNTIFKIFTLNLNRTGKSKP
jgi:hypothetical protein